MLSPKSAFFGRKILVPLGTARRCHTVTKNVTKKIKIFKNEGSHRPLCVIMGWGGSSQRNLERYVEIFRLRGYNAVTVTPTLVDILLFPETKGKKISHQILETITNQLDASKTVFFQFSNGGCGLYYFICNEICNSASPFYKKVKIIGSIFDSCPVVPNKESVELSQRAFTMNIKNPIFNFLVWHSIGVIVPFVIWLNPIVKVFMKRLIESPISAPQLFLYSKSDLLAPYKDISDFIDCRKDRGVQTMQMLWEHTPHVSHLKHDQETYSKMLNDFLDKIDA